MFTNPSRAMEIACERQREMLAGAEQQSLVRRLRAESRTARHGKRPERRLRHARRAADGFRTAPQA